MGRGLSDLQKYILTAAISKKDDPYPGRLYYADIFRGFYGWKGQSYHDLPGGRAFDPKAIGQKKYDSAHVAVRKACARLEKRGFVNCITAALTHWAAVEITDEGREFAAALSAKANQERAKPKTKAIELPEIDPCEHMSLIGQAFVETREGKTILARDLDVLHMPEEDIIKLVGVEPTYLSFVPADKKLKRLKVAVACYTPAHTDALKAKHDEIERGLCDGTLTSKYWCANCAGFYRYEGSEGKYVYRDDIPEGAKIIQDQEKGNQFCAINYGKARCV